jgi:asparagine synthase (glutamine-hydrolysing)
MCGIAGLVTLREGLEAPTRELLTRMAGALTHRGPDEFGVFRDSRAGLAHSRLSIIDLSSGQQPLANEDHSLWIVFNGEIFNYVELREELLGHGHSFRTKSDTEVIVHAWEQWGADCFARFNGQWAIALWDRNKRELVLSRDRYGIRPLYYVERDGRLWFASEVKAIFQDPRVPRELDPQGLSESFTFWSALAPRTVFRDVLELEPGHVRVYRDGQVNDRAYWTPSYDTDPRFERTDDAAHAVHQALLEATSLRMLRADVPVGSYLSGGLDSSLIATLGRDAVGHRFKTFSVAFEDAEFDETPYQQKVVERIGTEHHRVLISKRDIGAVFPEVVLHTERPILRTAPAPMFLLSKLVREQGIKVVLTGEGADEMFAGYDLFREAKVRRFWARRPDSSMRPRLLERLYPYLARSPVRQRAMTRSFFGRDLARANEPGFSHGTRWSSTSALQRLFGAELSGALAGFDPRAELMQKLPADFHTSSPLAQDQYLECRTLMSSYLLSSQGDRMLMANSVEGRFPFLDKNVVALANSLPDGVKLCGLDEKHVLKRLARDLLPEEVVKRPKQPYRAPDAPSFFGEGAPAWVDDVVSEDALRRVGVFEPKAALALVDKCRTQARSPNATFSNTDNMGAVGLLSTQLLALQFVLAVPAAPAPSLRTLVELD